ncbi:RNA-guided endonuclease TnpB family protein [Nocardiopsis sp. CNS-639]|uniref:RNA-guided endonuclease InsQ/TnpB family protein n=1 Tax=Nocardiopsis sp. CNS-639 TaxID=1169153 RepID=UPI0018CBDB52|nr:RNA-guided endonuclease TnpB family protein [Nocardiopsis sp. CNS-639]
MAEVLRTFKYTLDPTSTQLQTLSRYSGNARLAFNFALAMKKEAHQQWRDRVDALVATGVGEKAARDRLKGTVKVPKKPQVYKAFQMLRGDAAKGIDGTAPWHAEIPTHVFQSAWINADRAWQNWIDSYRGTRAGRRVGYPRFKKKFRSRDSFRLHQSSGRPVLRLEGYRRLQLSGQLGTVRLHGSAKRLHRLVSSSQAKVQSVTISRSGSRWYASVLCKVESDLPGPTRRQRANNRVGLDWGVHHLAALSTPIEGTTLVDNPKHLAKATTRLRRAQRALARTQKGSKRRRKAASRVGKLHHQVAEQRATFLHALTKRLCTTFAFVAVEDLNVAGMTHSARGTKDKPGTNVRAKAGLNRSVLDTAPGELRRQLEYKTSWYGSQLALCDRWFPSSKTCSACGWQNPSLSLSERVFVCAECGLRVDRDLNAARNIAAHAEVPSGTGAPGRGESVNARGGRVSPQLSWERGQRPSKREDAGLKGLAPPRRSNPPTSLTRVSRT